MPSMKNKSAGFTLMEFLVAVALGLIVLAAATQLFKGGMDATILVSQQSEMQQNVRAALNLIAKDVSMAGSGLPPGGFALPNGAGANPSLFGVDSNRAWLNNNSYPAGLVGGAPVSNYMYGVIPGPNNGMEAGGATTIAATSQGADATTVIYQDYAFPLNQYTVTFPGAASGNTIDLAPPVGAPPGFPAILSPGGIQVGDLILLNNPRGWAVGEVTGINQQGAELLFADNDPLNLNQSGASKGNIKYIVNGGTTVANRIWAITYFIEAPSNGQPPRLMRQVNGQTPQPVADNIIGLNFNYDVCDGSNTGTNCASVADPIGSGYSPNQIRKVNIQVMGQSLLSYGNRSRSMVLSSSVSTRSLAFKDRY